MHPKSAPAFISFGLKTLGIAVASVVLSSAVHAAGMGKLTVLSSLGQPLLAEIELSAATEEEAASLVAKLAPVDAFQQAKISFHPVLLSLRFTIERRGGRQVIRMTSTQPINEPFVDVLLELGGNKGRLIREYTFLLDPTDLRLSQTAQVVAPVTVPVSSERRQVLSTAALPAEDNWTRATRPSPAAKERLKPIPAKDSASYRVRSGDTLTGIAAKLKPEGVSLDQMLVALYQANPNGFIGNNMNRMRAGIVLSVPDSNAASGIASSSASAVVVAQAADFNAYRNQLAGKVARSTPKSQETKKQSATGKIETQVEETQAIAAESKDKLKLSKGDAVPGNAAGLASAATVGSENRIAADKAVEETTARIKNLEKNINDLQRLLEIKNKALSEQQHNAQTTSASEQSSSNAVAPSVQRSDVVAQAAAPEHVPAAAEKAPLPSGTAKPNVTVAQPLANGNFFDDLLSNSLLLPGAGILIAILGALGIYSNRRRKKPRNKFDDSVLGASHLQANSLFGSTGGQSVDTNNSVFNSSFSPSASQLDANEVDPVAEADVYIAYGRDAQAEEILKEALRTQPDRHPVRLKLLEIYANRKDLRSFEMLASELYGMTKGETDEWHQAARLGATLDPNNPLYAGGALSDEVAAKTGALGAPTLPLEELDPEALLSNSQSHFDMEPGVMGFRDIEPVVEHKLDSVASVDAAADLLTEAQNSLSHGLDFDLGEIANLDLKSGPVSAQEVDAYNIDFVTDAASGVVTGSKAESGNAMSATAAETAETAPAPIPPKFDLGEVDFNFLDSSATENVGADQDFQLPLMEAAPVLLPDMNTIEIGRRIESNAFDTEAVATPSAEKLEFDLSEIDLDFNPANQPNLSTQVEFNPAAHSDMIFGDSEMSTKLDLAIAYQEIGDKEGARELLEEVVKDGAPEEVEKAKIMLADLG